MRELKMKLIIENRCKDMDMTQAVEYALAVVKKGRISDDGKQYCYGTVFNDDVVVFSSKNKKSDRLVVDYK